jgi:hypothetical protein
LISDGVQALILLVIFKENERMIQSTTDFHSLQVKLVDNVKLKWLGNASLINIFKAQIVSVVDAPAPESAVLVNSQSCIIHYRKIGEFCASFIVVEGLELDTLVVLHRTLSEQSKITCS